MKSPGSRSIQRPALGVPSLSTTGDGIAYVSRLVHQALVDELGEVAVLQIKPRGGDAMAPTSAEAIRYAERIVRTQMVSRPDWWLFTHLGPARLTRKLPRAVRRPYAVFVHGLESWAPELGPGRKEVLQDAKLRIANSTYTARRIEHTHPELGAVVPCPLGLLPDAPRVARRPDDDEDATATDIDAVLARLSPRTALIVGRMDENERYKGHDVLIDAWQHVRDAVPDAQLVVVGQGTDLARLKSKAVDAGVADSVIFTGFISDVALRALRHRVSLFAMPSTGEGFGLVYLEAMRDRLPCIASNIDAAGDVIANGETGFLVDPTDPGAVASAIVPLLEDESLRTAMGAAGNRRFEAMFSYEQFRKRFLDIIEEHFHAG
jgi:phosphatidylinositol alpha-1,6-mannosyltransferase